MTIGSLVGTGSELLDVQVEFASPSVVILNAIVILALVLLNGFFVASEFALVKVRSSQLDALEDEGNKRAAFVRHVISNLDAYLSCNQLGITLSSLGLGWIGEPYVAQLLQPILLRIGVSSPTVISGISFAIGFSLITYLHIVLGELTPKTLAIRKSLGASLLLVAPLHLFYTIFRPAIWFLQVSARLVLKCIFRENPVAHTELRLSEQEFRVILPPRHSHPTTTPLTTD